MEDYNEHRSVKISDSQIRVDRTAWLNGPSLFKVFSFWKHQIPKLSLTAIATAWLLALALRLRILCHYGRYLFFCPGCASYNCKVAPLRKKETWFGVVWSLLSDLECNVKKAEECQEHPNRRKSKYDLKWRFRDSCCLKVLPQLTVWALETQRKTSWGNGKRKRSECKCIGVSSLSFELAEKNLRHVSRK